MSTGMPAGIWLNKFGVIVRDYFGHVPYHVGSSLRSKDWRDVDVRLILPDDEYAARFGSVHESAETNPRLAAITLAFSALGKEMTGLPIDFQIQPQTWANEKYPAMRSALIEVWPAGLFPGTGTPGEAGRLLPEPVETRTEAGVEALYLNGKTITAVSPPPVGATKLRDVQRTVREYADKSMWVGPWVPVPDPQEGT